MKKILIISIPNDLSKSYVRREVNKLIKNLKVGQTINEKECTHPFGCDMVRTKFICTKEGYCDK